MTDSTLNPCRARKEEDIIPGGGWRLCVLEADHEGLHHDWAGEFESGEETDR